MEIYDLGMIVFKRGSISLYMSLLDICIEATFYTILPITRKLQCKGKIVAEIIE